LRSARGLDEPHDLARLRHAPGATLGEDGTAVHGYRQLAEAAPANFRRHVEAGLQLIAKAHGLAAQVRSQCAALDFDLHCHAL
jgi:hypothetical protein